MSETQVLDISAKDLTRKILSGEMVFILDVRNTDDFDDWKIEGKNVEVINTPYFELMEGVDPVLDQLPKGQPIYVVCAKGGSSRFVAEQIAEAGYDQVYSIEGGMKAWSEHLEPVKVGDVKGGSIIQFVRIGKGCLSYLIESNGEAAIIDSARTIEPYVEYIKKNNLNVTYVLDTHLHADHISGGRALVQELGGKYYLPPKDAEEVTFDYGPLEDGAEFQVGETVITAMYSPGHTIGSTSFIVDNNYLLTGDILFIDSIGRPDLAGKAEDWVADLRETLYTRYKQLTDNLLVLPAHYMGINEMNKDGSISRDLSALYKENHGLNINEEAEFRRTVTENLPPQPNAFQDIRQTNMGKISPDIDEQREMEIGPNRCAVR
ncbi:MBL fold metallo-hydrolase [Alkalihalophilus marmarensis]|uniref:MBL fold metallo-hydrolase n=1 Tax=Alkalihalophilus marmarensis TaxID=521377 RepID=UPI002E23D1B4|nr:MBL fold metallo-hydrolase [Alkalihalophilus marmarensis]